MNQLAQLAIEASNTEVQKHADAEALAKVTSVVDSLKPKSNPNLLWGTRCYLIGHMQYADGRGWRQDVKTALKDTGVIFFDPYIKPFVHDIPEDENARVRMKELMEAGQFDMVQQHMWEVRGYDLRLCDISDFFIAHILPSVASWGSAEELVTITREKKPIFLCIEGGKKKSPLWEMGKIPHKYMYDSIEEIIDSVKAIDAGIIKMNSDRWKLLKKCYRTPVFASSEMIYLATPYSHPDHSTMIRRYETVNRVCAELLSQGKFVYSPITHNHPLAELKELPRGWDYWSKFDRRMLQCCNKVVVLRQEGWETSIGVQAEVNLALEMGLSVEYIDP